LRREVDVRRELVDARMRVDEPPAELLRVRGGVADAPDAGKLGDVLEQQGEIRDLPVGHPATVGVDVLAEQGHFPDALVGEIGDLGEHVLERTRQLLAPRVGHHAEAAILAAALHDGHEGAGPFDARRGKVVELLHLREADVHLRTARAASRIDQVRQPVQRLRAEDQVDIGRARHDRVAFLARNAAAHADEQIGPRLLQRLHAPEVVKHLLLRLFADRAGVEQDQVGVLGPVRCFEATLGAQDIRHLFRVVRVHLAAERADENLTRHASCLRGQAWAARARRA